MRFCTLRLGEHVDVASANYALKLRFACISYI